MIFVTIGTQEPFDRLIKAVDEIAPLLGQLEIVAQVSKSNYKVKNMQTLDFASPTDFNTYFEKASLIISHAGMGTIISALEKGKPIVVLPRLLKFNEHRSDHQLATAKRLVELNYVHVAFDEAELKDKIFNLLNTRSQPLHKLGKYASDQLLHSVQNFIVA